MMNNYYEACFYKFTRPLNLMAISSNTVQNSQMRPAAC